MKVLPFLLCLFFIFSIPAYTLDIHQDILLPAQRYIGSTYCHGGTAPPCFDCSGFVQRIYRPIVPNIPRVSRDMAQQGTPVSKNELVPGDLVFFATAGNRSQVTHVAIYLGQDSIIHAISNGPDRGVNITPLSSGYWQRTFHSARRILPVIAELPNHTGPEPREFSQGSYTGELQDGEPHGTGEMELRNGDHYAGTFQRGFFHGSGVYTWRNGDQYRGSFENGLMHGQGIFSQSGGSEISGQWSQGELIPPAAQDRRQTTGETAQDNQEVIQVQTTTYNRTPPSAWDTWDGVVEGDFRAWQQQEQDAFRDYQRSQRQQ